MYCLDALMINENFYITFFIVEIKNTVVHIENIFFSGIECFASHLARFLICTFFFSDILGRKRGNAIDATVAALIATGVLSAHSAGIGGGSFFVIYHK